MEVILLESFDKLGKIGDTVIVKDGFARNYLLPQKKALRANEKNKKYYEKIKEDLKVKNNELIEDSRKTSEILKKTELIFIRQASDSGQLYGSVSPKDISVHLEEKKIIVPSSSINLTSPIKNIGIFDVVIKLHAEVSVKVILNVATSTENASEQKRSLEMKNEKKSLIKNEEKIVSKNTSEANVIDSKDKKTLNSEKIEEDENNIGNEEK